MSCGSCVYLLSNLDQSKIIILELVLFYLHKQVNAISILYFTI